MSEISEKCKGILKEDNFTMVEFPDGSFYGHETGRDYEIWFAPNATLFPSSDVTLWGTYVVYVYLWKETTAKGREGAETGKTRALYFGQAKDMTVRYRDHWPQWKNSNEKAGYARYAEERELSGILWFRRQKKVNSQIDALALERSLYFAFPKYIDTDSIYIENASEPTAPSYSEGIFSFVGASEIERLSKLLIALSAAVLDAPLRSNVEEDKEAGHFADQNEESCLSSIGCLLQESRNRFLLPDVVILHGPDREKYTFHSRVAIFKGEARYPIGSKMSLGASEEKEDAGMALDLSQWTVEYQTGKSKRKMKFGRKNKLKSKTLKQLKSRCDKEALFFAVMPDAIKRQVRGNILTNEDLLTQGIEEYLKRYRNIALIAAMSTGGVIVVGFMRLWGCTAL